MRESIKTIKFCGIMSIIFLVLTYIVSVNQEYRFFTVNSVWISNSFLITLFGGIFTGMVVAVLSEIQKYYSLKVNTEKYIFFQCFYLYQALVQMKINIEDYIKHSEWTVTDNLFDESIRMIHSEVNALQGIDYATSWPLNNSLMLEYENFKRELLQKIQPVLQSGSKLKISINEIKIDRLEQKFEKHTEHNVENIVTSKSHKILSRLNGELANVSLVVAYVDSYIEEFNKLCNNRYRWGELKKNFVVPHLEDIRIDDSKWFNQSG